MASVAVDGALGLPKRKSVAAAMDTGVHEGLPAQRQAPDILEQLGARFDKVAYQREYMRKRRAIAKAKSNA